MRELFITGIFLIISTCGFSQTVSELKQKKEKAAKDIEYTTSLLNEIQKNEQASLDRLKLLNNRLAQRNILISNINNEISIYQEFIDDSFYAVQMLQEDLQKLKQEYAELIRLAYRNKNINNVILFVLSAENFNQAYRRFLYMKRYTTYRKKQVETIKIIQELLNEKAAKLKELQQIKQQLINETRQETQKIFQEKQQQNIEVQKLQNQKRSLREKLNQQQRLEQQLEREIQQIIEEETNKNKEAGIPEFFLTPEQTLAGNNFEQNQRHLPWPTERGIITDHFGMYQHPVLSNIQIKNNGITISTEVGAKVWAVFNGEVTRVFGVTGGKSAVIIRHGKYLTVYSNLREVIVKKGDNVQSKQIIGTVYTDYDEGNKSILKFQIWRENQKLDPEEWLVK